jgi:predicted lipoprotein with Yx(FWY)xxD motif
MRQWAYAGKPLYLYDDDDKPGDAEGDGEGGVWHVVK